MPAESPEHIYACWYPVGSPEYHERRAQLDAEPVSVIADDTAAPAFEDVS